MNKPNSKTKIIGWALLSFVAVLFLTILIVPNFVIPISNSPANTCINNLRNIDLAKNIWALNNNKPTNAVPTWDDIKPFLDRGKWYYKFDPTNNLPTCPSGGTYIIGKIGENPTCSLGTTITPAHVLP